MAEKTSAESQLLYSKAPSKKSAGVIVSNEVDRFQWSIPRGEGSGYLGFGSTTNWDLLALRRCKFAVLADQSMDVLRAHQLFYKPIFLASVDREAFVASVAGYRKAPLESLFTRMRASEAPLPDELAEARELIAEPFVHKVWQSRIEPGKSAPFENLEIGDEFRKMFAFLHHKKSVSEASRMPRLFLRMKKFSFLANEEAYAFVRRMYLDERIAFARADILDAEFYAALKPVFETRGAPLTDFYVSNIPAFLPEGGMDWLKGLLSTAGFSGLHVFETVGKNLPFSYCTHRW